MNIHDISRNTPYFIMKRLQHVKKTQYLHSDSINNEQNEINIKYWKT